jgi:energy-coupling factor transporter ATP-binding protein EcfA2
MRFTRLEIDNFRAIERARFEQLPDMVVIAGPNGCGKSTVFDAIRLFKSAYGGYQLNEWQNFFGEFQINLDQNHPDLLNLFRNRSRPVRLAADVSLTTTEREYLSTHAEELLRPAVWERLTGTGDGRRARRVPVAAQIRQHGKEVDRETAKSTRELLEGLSTGTYAGQLVITPDLQITIDPSPVLQLVFSLFQPDRIGIIDYHSAQRSYNREQVGGINLSIESVEQHFSQHALYNFAAKYQNIKTQMASGYIRELLMQEANQPVAPGSSLITTLKDMFQLFFADKEFLGPVPTAEGRLLFPVRTKAGLQHDINDLSSGEKEVLFGYLRLRNVSPSNSVLLLDEPELHLNPRLIQGLPQFYHKHLGLALGNQLWLLTHSDALLREAVGQPEFAVYHMHSPESLDDNQNQVRRITVGADVERATIDLVGDLAAYKPGAKVVIFEGEGDVAFNVAMTTALFPEFAAKVNLISGTNKSRVRQLHMLLERAASEAALPAKFFSICDRDSEPIVDTAASALTWGAYHIENYLLEPEFIRAALQDALGAANPLTAVDAVEGQLAASAGETITELVRHKLELWANAQLTGALKTRSDRSKSSVAPSLAQAVAESVQRLTEIAGTLTAAGIATREAEVRDSFAKDLESGEWRRTFRGRSVLKRFTTRIGGDLSYEVLRNLVVARMRDANFKPVGMQQVLAVVLNA